MSTISTPELRRKRSEWVGHSLAAMQHAPLAMAAVEGHSHIVREVNSAFCALVAQTEDQLLGKPFATIRSASEYFEPLLDLVFRTGKPASHTETQESEEHLGLWTSTMWPVMADGSVVGVIIQVTLRALSSEKVLVMNEALVLGSVRQHELTEAATLANTRLQEEINERKLAQAALRKNQEQHDHLVARIPVGIYIMRSRLGGAFSLDYVSPRMAEMFNASVASMLANPRNVFAAIHPDDLDTFVRSIQEGIRDHRPIDWRGRILTEGTVKWLHVAATPEPLENGEALWNGLVVDFTERRQALADKDELEAQNRHLQKTESLGRMAGAIAHTFNNQLGVVIGNLELALMDLPKGEPAVENLNAAIDAAGKAAAVSGQMLTYLGQSFEKREIIDLSQACSGCLAILRAGIPRRVVLETNLPTPGPTICGSVDQIQRVLSNLISNAWEAIGENTGSIHLGVETVCGAEIPTTHRYPLNWLPKDDAYSCLRVTDTGSGILDKDIENLFDPFFSSKFTGRGLGLAEVAGIVKAHGGAIAVESELGRGSTFRVFLPLSPERVLPPVTKPASFLTSAKGRTVLLVEDEAMVRSMAASMLNRLGSTVLEAKDGVEAVDLFRKYQAEIYCVICDLTMPRMNGWETLAALRELAPRIPVVLASGYDRAQVMSGEHAERPQAFLGKPYTVESLNHAISEALTNKDK